MAILVDTVSDLFIRVLSQQLVMFQLIADNLCVKRCFSRDRSSLGVAGSRR